MIIDEKLPERAAIMEPVLGARLNDLLSSHRMVTNVRCSGLMFAVDFDGSGSRGDGSLLARDAYYALLRRGLLARPPKANTLSFSAPLIIQQEELLDALDLVDSTLRKLA